MSEAITPMSRRHTAEECSDTMEKDEAAKMKKNEAAKMEKNEAATGHGEAHSAEVAPELPSKWPFVIVGVILLGLIGWSGYGHWRRQQDALATRDATVNAVPEVESVDAKRDDQPIALTLPGATEPFDTANIYPRATGYVAERRVDIGSRVHKGDVLLLIEAPDLDQQLAQAVAQLGQVQATLPQARAQLAQASANLELAKATFGRTRTLTKQGYETFQNEDNQQANLTGQQAAVETGTAAIKVAEANIASQQATVDRLRALSAFEQVIAPFDGIVTARNVDVGDLLNANSSSGAPLFTVQSDDVLRISVQVPQNAAIGVREGLAGKVRVPQMPGRVFEGKVARSSVALTAASRSLTAEIDVPNPDHSLRAGLYCMVDIAILRDRPAVAVPAEALVFNQHGLQVAVIDAGSRIAMRQVTISRDLGTSVEVGDGLSGGERVVLDPPATLETGSTVKPRSPAEQNHDGSTSGQSNTGGQKGDGKANGSGGEDRQAKADPSRHG